MVQLALPLVKMTEGRMVTQEALVEVVPEQHVDGSMGGPGGWRTACESA